MFKKIIAFLGSPYHLIKNKWGPIVGSYLGSIGTYLVYLTFPLAASKIIESLTNNNMDQTYMWIGALAIAYLVYVCFDFLNYICYSKFSNYIHRTLYQTFLTRFTHVDHHFEEKFSRGNIINAIVTDTQSVPYFIDASFETISSFIACICLLVILFVTDWIIALWILIGLFGYALYVRHHSKKYEAYSILQKHQNDSISSTFGEILNGLREIKTLRILPNIQKKLETKKHRYLNLSIAKEKRIEKLQNSSDLIILGIKFFIYLILFYLVFYQNYTIAKVILLIGYYDILVENIDVFLTSYVSAVDYKISIDRVKSLLDYKAPLTISTGNYEETVIYGKIEFDHVSVETSNKVVLEDISFQIEPNTINVIVGKSGSGKSIILDLLMRFQKIKQGSIYLDGRDIYEYSDLIYANNITIVRQTPFFFHMSIQNNLRLVNGNKNRQKKVCTRVGIHDFIETLPQKYHTVLKNNASNLSGGQRQLLSIARSLLTEAEIILFDEVTSSLDPNTSKTIVELLKNLKQDHTIIIITNRENIMALADQILVVDSKKVVCFSSFQELQEHTAFLKLEVER